MIADRMARGGLGKTEVDLVCSTHRGHPQADDIRRPPPEGAEQSGKATFAQEREPGLARQLLATGAARPASVAHSAVLACLGSPQAHERTVRALTSPADEDVAIAQIYLRHRPLADLGELRAVASGIGRMTAAGAQVRALETLAKQRLADPQSLQEIVRLFPLARSLEVQRAIAGILIRSDTKMLVRADLARSLRQHRLKSPDGNDVIDVLIRLLQST
jgi:HEAT repeat protein